MSGFFKDEDSTEVGSKDEFAAVDQLEKEKAQAPIQEQPKPEDNIPPEYRGKSVEEVIRMHQEAKKLIGKHSEEVGFSREIARKATELLERYQPSDKGSPEKRQDADPGNSDAEFFASPKQTVEKVISQHPDVVAAAQFARQSAAERAYNTLKTRLNAEPKELLADPDFGEWVKENSFRAQALRHADVNNDADAAYEVLRNFQRDKADKEQKQGQQREDLTKQVQSDKRAVMVDAGVPGTADTGKTIYRASDLRNLQRTDPKRYEKLENEILRAYATGRVKFD